MIGLRRDITHIFNITAEMTIPETYFWACYVPSKA